MKTYEIRASRIVYDFYDIEANSLQEAESLVLCSTDKVNTLTTVSTVDYQDSELLEVFEDLFEVHDILEDIKVEHERKLLAARAKQPKAEW